MAKNYLITKGPKGLTDFELLVMFGFLLLDSKQSETFLSGRTGQKTLEDRFKALLAIAVEGDGTVETAQSVFGTLENKNSEHAGLKDVFEWVLKNKTEILALRKTWVDFQEAKYGEIYSQCDPNPSELVDLIEAARIIRWRAK